MQKEEGPAEHRTREHLLVPRDSQMSQGLDLGNQASFFCSSLPLAVLQPPCLHLLYSKDLPELLAAPQSQSIILHRESGLPTFGCLITVTQIRVMGGEKSWPWPGKHSSMDGNGVDTPVMSFMYM